MISKYSSSKVRWLTPLKAQLPRKADEGITTQNSFPLIKSSTSIADQIPTRMYNRLLYSLKRINLQHRSRSTSFLSGGYSKKRLSKVIEQLNKSLNFSTSPQAYKDVHNKTLDNSEGVTLPDIK